MAGPITFYELSSAADTDLEEIFDYTEREFGFDQAVFYLVELEIVFDSLVAQPELGRDRSEIKRGLRGFPKEAHVIFYRVMEDRIRIVRVIHMSRDLPLHLKLDEV